MQKPRSLPESQRLRRQCALHRASGGYVSPIVGVGASAGGLEAFKQLLENLPLDTGMAFVLVQHSTRARRAHSPSFYPRPRPFPVQEVTNDLPVEANHVYVIPPNANMSIARAF